MQYLYVYSQDMSQTVRVVIIVAIVLFPVVALVLQFTKEGQVKKVIDGYISVIKTEWYSKRINKTICISLQLRRVVTDLIFLKL